MTKRRIASLGEDGQDPGLLDYMAACDAWALSTYVACEFRCVYCITGAQGASTPRYPREQVASQLRRELVALHQRAGISVGGVCDAYPTVESHLGVTRAAVEELVAQRRRFVVITKGLAVLRDRELLASYPRARVSVSLCSVDDDALRLVDPRAPSADERLELIHELAAAGVRVAVSAAPWIPGVTDAQALLERIDARIPIRFGVLNVLSPEVAATPYGRRFEQHTVNEAFMQEFRRVKPRPTVTWLRPVPADGSERRCHPFRDLLEGRSCSGAPTSCDGVADPEDRHGERGVRAQ